ncbi:hypothetical protein [Streptosporangium sp. H16]
MIVFAKQLRTTLKLDKGKPTGVWAVMAIGSAFAIKIGEEKINPTPI